MVTAVALLLMAVLALLGTAAVVVTSTDILISGAYKASEQAFYAAEAGVEETRARLRSTAGANLIADTSPTVTAWRAYIGTLAMAQKANERCQGCVAFNSSLATHSRTNSLQAAMTYVVEIKHKTENPDGTGSIMYWGDDNNDGTATRNTTTGNNIYLVTSSGYTGNSFRTVEAEITKPAPISVPGPLYVEANSTVQGNSTHVIGTDQCGSDDRHGIATTMSPGSVNVIGGASITGSSGTDPDILYNAPNLDITGMVNSLKTQATDPYNVNSTTRTGESWGTPILGATLQNASTCTEHHIVHYNTNGTYIRLAGGTTGCGILLVEGNLEVNGGFSWNGIIIVTGSVTYSGGGNKQVTGGILAGGTVDADLISGNANIVYCSYAVNSQTNSFPLRNLSWRDLRGGN
jgi:Tfp pilus assembly protein PilX